MRRSSAVAVVLALGLVGLLLSSCDHEPGGSAGPKVTIDEAVRVVTAGSDGEIYMLGSRIEALAGEDRAKMKAALTRLLSGLQDALSTAQRGYIDYGSMELEAQYRWLSQRCIALEGLIDRVS